MRRIILNFVFAFYLAVYSIDESYEYRQPDSIVLKLESFQGDYTLRKKPLTLRGGNITKLTKKMNFKQNYLT